MSIRPIFAWYDFWIGLYYDQERRRIYVLPVPCCGIVIQLGPLWRSGHCIIERSLFGLKHFPDEPKLFDAPCFQHRWSGECVFELHKAGSEQGGQFGFWHPMSSAHWKTFVPDKVHQPNPNFEHWVKKGNVP